MHEFPGRGGALARLNYLVPRLSSIFVIDAWRVAQGVIMTLAELASFSTAVSGFAVTASVIYLAIQTHQNTRNMRAMIHQGATARTTSIITSLMDPDYCAAWIEGNGGEATPEAVRARQFFFHCSVALNSMEDLYVQHCMHLLNEEQFVRGSEVYRRLLAEPGMRKYWEQERV